MGHSLKNLFALWTYFFFFKDFVLKNVIIHRSPVIIVTSFHDDLILYNCTSRNQYPPLPNSVPTGVYLIQSIKKFPNSHGKGFVNCKYSRQQYWRAKIVLFLFSRYCYVGTFLTRKSRKKNVVFQGRRGWRFYTAYGR